MIEAPDGLVRLLSTALLHEALTSAQRKAVLTLTTSETPGHVAFQLKDDRSDRAPAPTAWTTAVVAEALGGRCRRGVFSPYRAIIDLPASRSTTTPTEKPGTHAAPAIPVSTSDAPPPRVLLVEDEMLIADTLADVLEDHGYSVEVRPTVTAALDYLATQVPDVVVTDLNLPDHRGEVLLECLTKDWPHVFTVVMSGRPLDTDTAAAAVDLVLNKPVASETLTTSLATLLSTASEPE